MHAMGAATVVDMRAIAVNGEKNRTRARAAIKVAYSETERDSSDDVPEQKVLPGAERERERPRALISLSPLNVPRITVFRTVERGKGRLTVC